MISKKKKPGPKERHQRWAEKRDSRRTSGAEARLAEKHKTKTIDAKEISKVVATIEIGRIQTSRKMMDMSTTHLIDKPSEHVESVQTTTSTGQFSPNRPKEPIGEPRSSRENRDVEMEEREIDEFLKTMDRMQIDAANEATPHTAFYSLDLKGEIEEDKFTRMARHHMDDEWEPFRIT